MTDVAAAGTHLTVTALPGHAVAWS